LRTSGEFPRRRAAIQCWNTSWPIILWTDYSISDLNFYPAGQRFDSSWLRTSHVFWPRAVSSGQYYSTWSSGWWCAADPSALEYDYKAMSALCSIEAKESTSMTSDSEAEAIKNCCHPMSMKSQELPSGCVAMEARAALYAGSIAKYGASTRRCHAGRRSGNLQPATDYYTVRSW